MICLLDANVLIASSIAEHEHHQRAAAWLATVDGFALCPVVEGALVRFLLRIGESPAAGEALLQLLHQDGRSVFWSDSVSYCDVDLRDVRGHRLVTDAYLAALAASHGGLLATFDQGIVRHRPTQTLLIP